MHTSNSAPMAGHRTGTPWYVYDERPPRSIMRADKRRGIRMEEADVTADLLDLTSTEPYVDRAEDTDFDHDLLDIAAADWADDLYDRLDMADRADEEARLRAERLGDFDADAICGWAAPTALVWSDFTDNTTYDMEDMLP